MESTTGVSNKNVYMSWPGDSTKITIVEMHTCLHIVETQQMKLSITCF
jgi:hypothetical protein